MNPTELNEFAAWAHAVVALPGVTIIIEGDPHEHIDDNPPHGSNTDEQMIARAE